MEGRTVSGGEHGGAAGGRRQQRMVKVVGGVVNHPDLLHHATRTNVAGHRERDDFLQPERLEAKPQGRPGTFRRLAAVPVFDG